MRVSRFCLGLSLLVSVAACDSEPADPYNPEYPVGSATGALLTKPATCSELLGDIRADALAKVEIQTQQYLESFAREGYDLGGVDGDDAEVPTAAPEANAGEEAPEHSETNTQVEGVDEADIVKTDGFNLYVLANNRLFILKSWPANETAITHQLAIEGYGQEMFVTENRAVIFSATQDPREPSPDCGAAGDEYLPYYYCYSYESFTKVTVVDLEESGPVVSRELYLEGYYSTSRRHNDQVRAVLNNWNVYWDWTLPQVWDYLPDEWASGEYEPASIAEKTRAVYEWRSAMIEAVLGLEVGDWLPDALVRNGGSLSEVPIDCDSYYITAPGLVDYGMTTIVGLDLGDSDTVHQTGIWGYAGQVYANADTMVIAQPDYSSYYRATLDEERSWSNGTFLHRFAIDEDGDTTYETSGAVSGSINNQFSIDERDGVIRVATTTDTTSVTDGGEWWDWTSTQTNHVFTLRAGDDGLEVIGSSGNLVSDERIQSARFLGDLAYVVTFRQVDPLFAVDLSDPEHPEVLGELEIPGFSSYIHPLGEDHLLTIGYDGTEDGGITGLALQIFDISDPVHPTQAHKYVFEGESWSGYSEANWNHKAFTFFADRGLLAFPYASWGSEADGWSYHSSLEVFSVSTEDGFTEVGSIDHTSLVGDVCDGGMYEPYDCYYSGGIEVRRGVFVEDFVYSISAGGVLVNDTRDMSTPVSSVSFTE